MMTDVLARNEVVQRVLEEARAATMADATGDTQWKAYDPLAEYPSAAEKAEWLLYYLVHLVDRHTPMSRLLRRNLVSVCGDLDRVIAQMHEEAK